MKYLKLAVLVLLAWAITYLGAAVLSLRAADGATASIAAHLWMRNDLPGFAQPKSFTYTDQGKQYTSDAADLDKYQAEQESTPLLTQLSEAAGLNQGAPGAWLLYRWCARILPWVSLALALWLLNIVASVKRLADSMG